MTTNAVDRFEQRTGRGERCERLERLDEDIIALLMRRQELAEELAGELPVPPGPRATDPAFTGAVRDITSRYRERLGGGGELVARAVLVLCHPGERTA
ncbi:hypothetical protein ACFVT5_08210 [Streptomyces sp. NPDC058001]|uniref:hypothetical protein n=1 Tax=Streptomyces sp. NPDC058001 TaxID=3346300 RepID=UPI0036EA6CE1